MGTFALGYVMAEQYLKIIAGYADLLQALGEPSEFHDGYVVWIHLDRDISCSIGIEVTCFDKKRHNIEVLFRNVTDANFTDWAKQNVVLFTELTTVGGQYRFALNASVGVYGSISAEEVEFRAPSQALVGGG